jgi:demethylmenaquinone methyltransferase/2-methoxy-6-polyprenyl-1,4-benzoquinol methylase
MIGRTVSAATARRFYDWIGARYDWVALYEGVAIQRAIARLDVCPGNTVVDVGTGTGKHLKVLRQAAGPPGMAIGVDISPVMLQIARKRSGGAVCQADARALPILDNTVDCLLATYLLDLIPLDDLAVALAEFRRVLKPGGRVALVSLTEGTDPTSRFLIALWKAIYRISPVACGGCRPVQLADLVAAVGFQDVSRGAVVQAGIPSEIVVATK